jgi:ADP-ribosyl-[dinitrogen reductase] hydrolase
MALCLADSLLVDPALDERDLLARFCRWRDLGENTSTGACVGIGQTTLRALADHSRTGTLRASPRARADGNGALMRTIPAALRHFDDVERAVDVARRQSLTTHASALSAACCSRFVTLACGLLQGDDWAMATLRQPPVSMGATDTDLVPAGWWRGLSADDVRGSGFVVDTLQAAFWAVDSTATFADAVIAAVNLGDDADTVGAVAGALAGCRYGESAIPSHWRAGLVRRDLVENAAARLADVALLAPKGTP